MNDWLFSEDPSQEMIPGETNFATVAFALAFLVILFTPAGYVQVRGKKTGKRVGRRSYYY